MKEKIAQYPNAFAIGLIVLAAITRLLPHPSNFTPMIAIALLGGVLVSNRWAALCIPLLAMLITDLFLGFHNLMLVVYVSIALAVVISKKWQPQSLTGMIGLSFSGALLFFILTNAGVWATSTLYTKDVSGLLAAYVAAIPFFQNTLLSTVLYFVPAAMLMRANPVSSTAIEI